MDKRHTIITQLSDKQLDQLHCLYKEEWWSSKRTILDVKRIVKNSSLIFGLVDQSDSLIAFCRVLTDHCIFAYIYDFIVKSKHLSSFLSIADALIVTLGREASAFSVPSKIYAYLTIGKPILGSMPIDNLGSEKIRNLKVGYVSRPDNIKAFLNYSKQIIKSKKLRLRLSRNSKNYLKKNTSIQQIKEIIKTMY